MHTRDISRKLKENGAKNGSARARSRRVLPYSANWVMIIPLVFFDLSKLLFLGSFNLKSFCMQPWPLNTSKYYDCGPLRYTCTNNISQDIGYETLS